MGNITSKRKNSCKPQVVNNNHNNHNNNTGKNISNNNNIENPKLIVPDVTVESPASSPVPEKPVMSKTAFVPKWVTSEYFEDILQENFENYEKILEFKAYPALSAGENYATQMLRVHIKFQLKDNTQKEICYMLKVPYDNDQMKQFLDAWDFFRSENLMYTEALPLLEKLYKDIGLDVCFGAKSFQFKKYPGTPTVLLEDLRPSGFKNADRRECLNMEHCQAVLKKLAQLHAASATYIRKVGPFHKILMEGLGDIDSPVTKAIFSGMMNSFQTAFLRNMSKFKDYQLYQEMLEKHLKVLVEEYMLIMKANLDEFCILNHGDAWTNNILFKYSKDGRIEDTYFVDFQLSKIGSPVQDLLYFIMSSTQIDIKINKFDYLVSYYHEQLTEHLKLLDYPLAIPTLRELHMEILKKGFFAFITVVMTLPAVLLDPNENANLDNFISDNQEALNLKNAFFTNPRYIMHINEILPFLYRRGLLKAYLEPSVEPKSLEEPKKPEEKTENLPEISKPEWLTKEAFVDILNSLHENFKEVKEFKVQPGSNAGENYASSLLCITIQSELQDNSLVEDSFMMKLSIESEATKLLMSHFDLFGKENRMYSEVIPALEEIYKKSGQDVTFAPRSFKFSKDPGCQYILVENLKPKGFRNQDRLTGLDWEHTKAILFKLAQFHASSATYVANKNKFEPIFFQSMFTEENRAIMEAMGEKFYDIFLDIVETYEGSEEYLPKFRKFQKHFHSEMIELLKVNPEEFNVLNHGDCWTNNVLFQHSPNGQIAATFLIDFQMCKFGSPAQDLHYFLMSSPQLDIKIPQFDQCIKFYHDHLVQQLQILKYPNKIPSLKELHIDLISKGGWACMTATGVMAAVLVPPTKDASMENMMGEDDVGIAFKKNLYGNANYRKHATVVFKWLNQRGILDIESRVVSAEKTKSPEIPEWLNEEKFQDILAAEEKDFEKILKFHVENATKTGDNYASLILRVQLEVQLKDGSKKDFSFILKTKPTSSSSDEMVTKWDFFSKETSMYKTFIPEFEKLFRESGKVIKLAPRFYEFTSQIDSDYILLEDLCPQGFKNADRFSGLDEAHTRHCLEKMAQFHAASGRYEELNGPYPDDLQEGLFREDSREMFKGLIRKSEPIFQENLRTYRDNEKYLHKMKDLRVRLIDNLTDLSKPNSKEFNILNHGDSWINNILFQHDEEGNITETLYVDYQVCKYGPPVQDLYYLLMSSTHLDIKTSKFDQLIEFYHEKLLENLKLLKYEGKLPTLQELQESLQKYKALGVLSFLGTGALALMEPSEAATVENLLSDGAGSNEVRNNMYGGKYFKAQADILLPWMNDRGFLDP